MSLVNYTNYKKAGSFKSSHQSQNSFSHTEDIEKKSPEASVSPEIEDAPVIDEAASPLPYEKHKDSGESILSAMKNDIFEKKDGMLLKAIIYSEILSKPISRRKGMR